MGANFGFPSRIGYRPISALGGPKSIWSFEGFEKRFLEGLRVLGLPDNQVTNFVIHPRGGKSVYCRPMKVSCLFFLLSVVVPIQSVLGAESFEDYLHAKLQSYAKSQKLDEVTFVAPLIESFHWSNYNTVKLNYNPLSVTGEIVGREYSVISPAMGGLEWPMTETMVFVREKWLKAHRQYVSANQLQLQIGDIVDRTNPEQFAEDRQLRTLVKLLLLDEAVRQSGLFQRTKNFKKPDLRISETHQWASLEDLLEEVRKVSHEFTPCAYQGLKGVCRQTTNPNSYEFESIFWVCPGLSIRVTMNGLPRG